ncbi:MAG: ATP-binding protein, partial [Gaiellaceae bacterium]
STRQTFVTGDAVNTAARLEQAAAPGEILLGELTHRLAKAGLEAEPIEPITAKGKAEPVPAYRLLTVSLGRSSTRPRKATLVGRAGELAALERAFAQVATEQRCHLATVVGEPGVGKSRLCAELIARLAGSATVYTGRCLSYGESITFWPVAEIIRPAAGIRDEHSPAEARDRVSALVEPGLADRVCALIGLGGDIGTEEAPWVVRRLFEGLTTAGPIVALIEDVHWAEPTLLDIFEHIAARAQASVFLLCTSRPELAEIRPGWPVTLRLEPLAEEEVGRLIEPYALAKGARRRVVASARGNPLFAEELAAYLREQPGAIEIPATLSALRTARLDLLPEPERAAAERGSIEGEVFHRGAVVALSGHDVREELDALAGRDFLRPAQASFVDEAAFGFKHVLVRDAAYNGTAKKLRAELHERFADWLEDKAGERLTEYEEILGYHLEQAYRYREELGPPDEQARELATRAAARLGSSGRRAFARGDEAGAATLLGRAASLLRRDDRARLDLLPMLAEALAEAGRFDQAGRLAEEMLELAGADVQLQAHALVVQIEILFRTEPERAFSHIRTQLEKAIGLFESIADELGLAKSWRLMAAVPFFQANAAETEVTLFRAAEHARRAGDRREELYNLRYLAEHASNGRLHAKAGLRRCNEFIEQAAATPSALAEILLQRARVEAMLGHRERAGESFSQARAIQEELGLEWGLAYASFWRGSVELDAGNAAVAAEELQRAYEELLRLGDNSGIPRVACMRARALYEQGRDEEAERLTEVAEQRALHFDLDAQALWRAERGKLLARRGDVERGKALVDEAVALARRSDWLNLQAEMLMSLAEVLRLDHRLDEAAAAADEAASLYEQKGNVMSAARARERRAALATPGAR